VKKKILCLYLIVLMPSCAHLAQTRQDVQWWLSTKDSPLQFSAKTERYLDLVNMSQKVVTSHTLACAIETQTGYKVDKVFPHRRGELKPSEAFIAAKSWYERTYLAQCKNPACKLVVFKVTFADGGNWTLAIP
jgi:hypothetical protein